MKNSDYLVLVVLEGALPLLDPIAIRIFFCHRVDSECGDASELHVSSYPGSGSRLLVSSARWALCAVAR